MSLPNSSISEKPRRSCAAGAGEPLVPGVVRTVLASIEILASVIASTLSARSSDTHPCRQIEAAKVNQEASVHQLSSVAEAKTSAAAFLAKALSFQSLPQTLSSSSSPLRLISSMGAGSACFSARCGGAMPCGSCLSSTRRMSLWARQQHHRTLQLLVHHRTTLVATLTMRSNARACRYLHDHRGAGRFDFCRYLTVCQAGGRSPTPSFHLRDEEQSPDAQPTDPATVTPRRVPQLRPHEQPRLHSRAHRPNRSGCSLLRRSQLVDPLQRCNIQRQGATLSRTLRWAWNRQNPASMSSTANLPRA